MNNRDFRRVQALVGHPEFQRFCADFAAQAGVEIPRGVNPAGFVIANLHQEDPGLTTAFVGNMVQVHERVHGAPPPSSDDAHDWDRELPAGEVLKAWKALPEHSRLPQAATSPQWEAIARRDLARAGVAPIPGLTAGQTELAVLHYMGKHSGALKGGNRAVYDSLARRIGGALGDGEAVRSAVDRVKKVNYDDYVLHRIAEKNAAAEAEAAKHRPKPAPQPTFDKKFTPQSALRPKEKPKDTTRDEVARQYARQKGGWELPENRRPEPLRKTISDKLEFDVACALAKQKGQSLERVVSRLSPHFHKQVVADMRERGLEPAMASSRGNSSARNWVQAPPSSFSSGESYPSGGGYSDGGSGEATSEAPDSTGTGQ